ncbi:MAG: hypothetical protein AAGI51_17215, partial [Pseudomonadota bacterium]
RGPEAGAGAPGASLAAVLRGGGAGAVSGPVVAVCGPPGAGKSTLAAELAGGLAGAMVLDWDDYETFTHAPPDVVAAWLDHGADPAEIETPGLVDALRAGAARGPVVFETPFGRAHPQTGGLIDVMVWIALPADLALARKLSALMAIEDGPPADWLRGWLQAYATMVRPALDIQGARVRPRADLEVNGEASIQDQAAAVRRALSSRG